MLETAVLLSLYLSVNSDSSSKYLRDSYLKLFKAGHIGETNIVL